VAERTTALAYDALQDALGGYERVWLVTGLVRYEPGSDPDRLIALLRSAGSEVERLVYPGEGRGVRVSQYSSANQ
jgi:hypothetical protein